MKSRSNAGATGPGSELGTAPGLAAVDAADAEEEGSEGESEGASGSGLAAEKARKEVDVGVWDVGIAMGREGRREAYESSLEA